jgi:xanthine dehydrogenase small subunit
MRDHLVLYINGQRHTVAGRDAFLSLSDYLRRRCGLIGTKIVCSEGDCGACTVLVGRAHNPPPLKGGARGEINEHSEASLASTADATIRNPQSPFRTKYLPIDSCIQFLFQLDGTHIVTVEGLGPPGHLNPVQQALVDCHGSQCGFCTPGFVMSMTGLLEECDELDTETLGAGLTGNLCRCTGYTQIIESGLECNVAELARLTDLYPPEVMLADFEQLGDEPVQLAAEWFAESHIASCPTSLNDALAFLAAHQTATIVAGATDLGVRINKTGRLPETILDLNRIEELATVRLENNTLIAGARATWTDVLAVLNPPPSKGGARGGISDDGDFESRNADISSENPSPNLSPRGRGINEFAKILALFGAPQIRHVGTIAGNIANASPIADSLPFLYVMETRLALASRGATRELNINNFYKGYKQLDLGPAELITEVRIPLPTDADLLRLYKVSRRRDLDISSLTAAIRVRLSDPPPSKGGARGGINDFNGAEDPRQISSASIALGAVGPTVIRPRRAEQFLLHQPFTEQTMQAAADIAVEEITPITDVRGAANYRRQLVRNIFRKFYHQTAPQPV